VPSDTHVPKDGVRDGVDSVQEQKSGPAFPEKGAGRYYQP
jgi:hypothetical protein